MFYLFTTFNQILSEYQVTYSMEQFSNSMVKMNENLKILTELVQKRWRGWQSIPFGRNIFIFMQLLEKLGPPQHHATPPPTFYPSGKSWIWDV